ncbi:FAD dependent oxidoreductase [Aspergillus heteromorphus CBS 117.55]|uniref:FAD dependent oxidoreductase n=1 Tax=Aspergillus heteromorphus CBS 117.55 TaxID=1448321 RepID=A0A317WQG3_9EURO|nr:FAD dependent oxidoreductase [Aspergillus heteromorphus CBS 117.55]PWY87367.1 FAD dependent oxidoreductase [Aspergillus heteromorphus CBS 117.55]
MAPSTCFPVPNPGDCFWQTEPHELHDFRSTEQLPAHAEVVIIGAGYAGASTAHHLLRDHGDAIKSITILEARGACSGATGRNGGHLRPDFYGHIPTYVDRAGVRAGAEIAEFEISHLHAMKKLIEEEQIDCDFTLARSIDVWCNPEAAQKAQAVYERMKGLGLEYMNDVAFYTGKNVEGICGVKGAVACASFTAGTMWPYKFILHILRAALATGKLNLQTFTPATAVTPRPQGGFTVETPRGAMHADTVIHANNAYVSALLPEYAHNIVPCKGICCRITVPEGRPAPLLNNSYINRTEDHTLSYLIPRPDGSIIVGGASSQFRPFRDQWYNNVDDSVLIDSAKDYYNGYMQRTYRGWEDSGATVDQIWTGVMGYSFDSNPHIGAVPGKADQFILAGFNGHGMPVIWRAAQELARMVVEKIPFEQTAMPRLFQTSQFRIDRAQHGSESDGDILGTGNFPATKP